MAKQFKDRHGVLWIADYFGSQPIGGARVGTPPIDVGSALVDDISMQEYRGSRKLLATLPHGRWANATQAELNEALEHALAATGER